jgi:hypothetical protein
MRGNNMDLLNVLEFIFITPFSQNWVFPLLIIIFFFINFVLSYDKNIKRFSQYKKHINTYMLEDYEEGISSSYVSGILMSIGIIGTFFLIYDSLSHLTMTDSASMMTMISSEIAPAFSISALGITASIFYVLSEKIVVLGSYKTRMNLLKYNNKDNLNTYSKTIANDRELNQEILIATQEQTRILISLNNSSNAEVLNPEVLGEVISKALLKDLKPLLTDIHIITKNVNTTSSKINKNSEDISQFLKEELKNDIIIPLKNSVDNTSKSMKNIESALEKTSEAMTKTNEGFDKLNSSLDTLKESQESFVKNLDGVLDKQRVEFEVTNTKIINTYHRLSVAIVKKTTTFEENSKTILNSFTGLSTNMKTFLDDYKKDYRVILDEQRQAIKNTSDESVKVLKETGKEASTLIIDASSTLQSNLKDVNDTLITTATQASTTISTAGTTASSTIRTAGTEASTLITSASSTLQNTLSGVDEALVKTSDKIQEELEIFRETYKEAIEETSKESLKLLKETGQEASTLIIDASSTLQSNLTKVNETLILTATQASTTISTAGATASSTIKIAGREASTLITSASGTLQNTLSGVDEALVKTSDKIQEELKKFRVTYTDTLAIFLETQGEQLEKVFGKNTKALTQIVIDFKEVLEDDTINRTTLNDKLNELIEKTNGFVAGTQTMITTAFDVQKVQLVDFMTNNIAMQGKLKNIIDDVEIINDNGNILTKELIDTTAKLQKQFNDNQTKVLEKYQLEIDTHLEKTMGGISDIAKGMLEVVELIHQTKEESEK